MQYITINGTFDVEEIMQLAVAVKLLDKDGIDVPTDEQLCSVALIVSQVSSSDYIETRNFLQSMISFQMEEGVRI